MMDARRPGGPTPDVPRQTPLAEPFPAAQAASRLAAAVAELTAARSGARGASEDAPPAAAEAMAGWPLPPPEPPVAGVGPARRQPSPPTATPPARAFAADGKPLRAVALRYDPFSGPPRVVATGRGHVAEALLARAREAGVPIEAQPDLVDVLMTLKIDQVIPPALYVAVAQVLAWAYLVDERAGRQRPGIEPTRR